MRTGDEQTLASTIQAIRARQGLSQADLAEAARVSTKTIQRLEAGKPIAGSSRRAVLTALNIDPKDLAVSDSEDPHLAASPWAAVKDARSLLESLAAARTVDVEVDRDGWRQARRQRPWYRRDLVFATRDPTDLILEIVDRASEPAALSPGRVARERDDLFEALRAAEVMGWGLATRVDRAGRLSLYIGAPAMVAERARQGAQTCHEPTGTA